MKTKVIFVNGPPRSGKDTAGDALEIILSASAVYTHKLSKELKERCHAAYYACQLNMDPLPHDEFEDCKDEPLDVFEGLTPRQAYIAFSENWLKPTHGAAKLGEWLAGEMDDSILSEDSPMQYDRYHIITDSGFSEECGPIIEKFGRENCILLRLHREGHTFEGDSRGYLDLDVGQALDVYNNSQSVDDYREELKTLILPLIQL